MPEKSPDNYEGVRRFMPGLCGPDGHAAQFFAESDMLLANEGAQSPMAALARAACAECLQLSHCQEQRELIAQTLHARGVELPIVGGKTVPITDDVRYMTQRERLALEPKFTFETRPLPEDAQTAAILLRQWLVLNWELLKSKLPASAKWAADVVIAGPVGEQGEALGLARQDATHLLQRLGKVLCNYQRAAKGASESQWRRRPHDVQVDIEAMKLLAPIYLSDAAEIQAMGFGRPELALYHGASFWRRLKAAYQNSHCISETAVIRYSRKRPRDPVPAIEEHVNVSTQRRAGQYNNPYRMSAEVRAAETARVQAELHEQGERYAYLTLGIIKKVINSCSSVEAARERIEELKDPRIATVAMAAKGTITDVALQYCLLHTQDPSAAVVGYKERVKVLTERVWETGRTDIMPSDIEAFAIVPSSAAATGAEVVQSVDATSLRRDFSYRCKWQRVKMHVPGWAFKKIAKIYPRDQHWGAVANLNELIETGIVRVDHLTCALEGEAADIPGFIEHAVGDKGAYITFTVEALARYNTYEQAEMMRRANLDLLVYGHPVPENAQAASVKIPLWLRPEELKQLRTEMYRGQRSARILRGDLPIPDELLEQFGYSKEGRREALSLVRALGLRSRNARQARTRASKKCR